MRDQQQNKSETSSLTSLAGVSVWFGNLYIHKYERTLGDSLCSTGPPISIGWKYRLYEKNTGKCSAKTWWQAYKRQNGNSSSTRNFLAIARPPSTSARPNPLSFRSRIFVAWKWRFANWIGGSCAHRSQGEKSKATNHSQLGHGTWAHWRRLWTMV